ncbi:MAG: lytic transglycosylase domain-containing protein [Tissierellia bacterium]|nr:lytic transglycosylase domain-containing protein [Tissierellia bacterium]
MKKFLDFFESIVKTLITLVLIVVIIALVVNAIYPLGYRDEIEKNSNSMEISPYLVMALINIESKFDKNAVSDKGAMGLMQIKPDTAEWIAENMGMPYQHMSDLVTPAINIRMGCWYLNYLMKEYKDVNYALAAYNAGMGNLDEWIKNGLEIKEGDYSNIPFSETRHYIRKIRSQAKTYETLDKIYARKNEFFTYGIEAFNWVKSFVKDKVNK